MFERFARDARGVVAAAETEARELGSPTIEAEHLLLAVTRATDPISPLAAALTESGLDHATLIEALDAERERSLLSVGVSIHDFDVPAAPRAARPKFAANAKRTLELSLRLALERGDKRITAGHILLALLRAEAGTVPRALTEAGIDKQALNDRVAAALNSPLTGC